MIFLTNLTSSLPLSITYQHIFLCGFKRAQRSSPNSSHLKRSWKNVYGMCFVVPFAWNYRWPRSINVAKVIWSVFHVFIIWWPIRSMLFTHTVKPLFHCVLISWPPSPLPDWKKNRRLVRAADVRLPKNPFTGIWRSRRQFANCRPAVNIAIRCWLECNCSFTRITNAKSGQWVVIIID